MRYRTPLLALALVMLLVITQGASAQTVTPAAPPPQREILVPFDDLPLLLEGPARRVLLSRAEYEDLLAEARRTGESGAPVAAAIVSGQYDGTIAEGRAWITGELAVEVCADGVQRVGLDLGGVGLRTATLDKKPAPLGQSPDGRLVLFVSGRGVHVLELQMVAPLQTTAAQQMLNFRLPMNGPTRFHLTATGDITIRGGATVITRSFDEASRTTTLELLPAAGDVSLVMSLNSHLRRTEEVVVARGVIVDEVTQAYERLHAAMSMAVLYRPVDHFRFAVPAGFEVTGVESPLLARWAIQNEAGQRVLNVYLREATTQTVVLNISGMRHRDGTEAWTFPTLRALDVAGQVAAIGLMVEDRLKTDQIAASGLIPIDTSVLAEALPMSVPPPPPEAGETQVRAVAAFYAPQAEYALAARFTRPAAEMSVTSNILLTLQEKGQEVKGGIAILPGADRLFSFDLLAPAGWRVTSVKDSAANPLAFERYEQADGSSRLRVGLPRGAAGGTAQVFYFEAQATPAGWLDDWPSTQVSFPVFGVAGATRQSGAIAVAAEDDLVVRPQTLEHLTTLDENAKEKAGLGGLTTNLAYHFEGPTYQAELAVERTVPRVIAQTYSFFRVENDALHAHYEVAYTIKEARTQNLALALPQDTPAALAIVGMDKVAIKEFSASTTDGLRVWSVRLGERRTGLVRLAVDFQQSLPALPAKEVELPVIRAEGVVYQTGQVAVEGSPDLDVQVTAHPGRIDVGELGGAQYQPGARLLGAYGFGGDQGRVVVSIQRPTGYGLPSVVVQEAQLTTAVSGEGLIQTDAYFDLQCKAPFLVVSLPSGSTLWSAAVDGKPSKPQRDGQNLLVGLPSGAEGVRHRLNVVYETPINRAALWSRVNVPAPQLLVQPSPGAAAVEAPVADLHWRLFLPSGYQLMRVTGSLTTDELPEPPLLVADVFGALYKLGGGVTGPLCCLPALGAARKTANQMKSSTQVRGIQQGMVIWAQNHNGHYPPDVATLAREGFVSPQLLLSPFATVSLPSGFDTWSPEQQGQWLNANTSYIYIRGLSDDADGNKITLFTKPSQSGGTGISVVFNDNHVTFVPMNEAEKFIEEHTGRSIDQWVRIDEALAAGIAPAMMTPGAAGNITAGLPSAPSANPWSMLGVDSLTIHLDPVGEHVLFEGLGAHPNLGVVVARRSSVDALAWTLALAAFLMGATLTRRSIATRIKYIFVVGVVAAMLPLVTGRSEWGYVLNGIFVGLGLLVPLYIVVALARLVWQSVHARLFPPIPAAAVTAALMLLLLVPLPARGEEAADGGATRGDAQTEASLPPLQAPDNAIIMPYDPDSKTGIRDATKVLLPYDRFVALWDQAHPERKINEPTPPAPFALGGAAYRATLEGEEFLEVRGTVQIDAYEGQVVIPLDLRGGVLAQASLDGQPAVLSIARAAALVHAAPEGRAREEGGQALVLLHVAGAGHHQLELDVRMSLQRRGGWRVVEGSLPAAPASALGLVVPDAETQVQLGDLPDRSAYDTTQPNQTIETVLGSLGRLNVQWRPRVGEGQVDQTLTAHSSACADVQEDGVHLAWTLDFEFRHGERSSFEVLLPGGYLVEKIDGANVRGWETRAEGSGVRLSVMTLKPASGHESFTVTLWRRGAIPAAGQSSQQIELTGLVTPGAALHSGGLTLRRSPRLEVRTIAADGLARTDLGDASAPAADTPLGLRDFQAYQFVATPFLLRLEAAPVAGHMTARVESLVKFGERERSLDSRVVVEAQGRPMYRLRLAVPADLRLDEVLAPGCGNFEWGVGEEGGRRILTVFFGNGRGGETDLLIRGPLGEPQARDSLALPHLEVLESDTQETELGIQCDPGFDISAEQLKGCRGVSPDEFSNWIDAVQRGTVRAAVRASGADFDGVLRLTPRRPLVACTTLTNVRVTDRVVQETILLDLSIQYAGIRQIDFLLPAELGDARISVPMLRQKTVTAVNKSPHAPLHVRLELQEEVMGQLRVLVESDRLRSDEVQRAPIPVVYTGHTEHQYVALESAGRDEVAVEHSEGLEALGRQQKEWRDLAGILGEGMTQVWSVGDDSDVEAQPSLTYRARQRGVVETKGARIGLAQLTLAMDDSGAYRAEQDYYVDNATEQFLEIRLPEGAQLWSAKVADQPVKPSLAEAQAGGAAPAASSGALPGAPPEVGVVRIPLVKTPPGSPSYIVRLAYAGTIPMPGGLGQVRFPLLRCLNINIELSQARLYLPPDLVWFNFGGTMGYVSDEGDLVAGEADYLTRELFKSSRDMQNTDAYVQSRGRFRFEVLKHEVDEANRKMAGWQGNANVAAVSGRSALALQDAEQQARQIDQAGRGAAAMDNRARLNDYVANQQVQRARNQVQELGANRFATTLGESKVEGKDQGQASGGWFNSLFGVIGSPSKPEAAAVDQGPRSPVSESATISPPQARPATLEKSDSVYGLAPGAAGQQATGSGIESAIYAGHVLKDKSFGLNDDGSGTQNATNIEWPAQAASQPAAAKKQGEAANLLAATGLASLDVEVPVRGLAYRFTTPRGEVEITARAVSRPFIGELKHLGMGVLIVVALLVAWRVVGRAPTTWITPLQGANALIIASVASMICGVLPIFGVVGLVAGILLRRRAKRLSLPAAA